MFTNPTTPLYSSAQVPPSNGTSVYKTHQVWELLKVYVDARIRGAVSLTEKKGVRGIINLEKPEFEDTSIK